MLSVVLVVAAGIEAPSADMTGRVLWSRNVAYAYPMALYVSPKGEHLALLEQPSPNGSSRLSLLNREGDTVWTHASDQFTFAPTAVSPNGTYVMTGYGNGVALFDGHGTLLWKAVLWTAEQVGRIYGLSVGEDGNGFVVEQAVTVTESGTYFGDSFLRLNVAGKVVGNISLAGPYDYMRTAWISERAQYVVLATGGTVSNYQVHLFTGQGQRLWSRHPGNGSIDTLFVDGNGSYVAAGSGENQIYLYSQRGDLLWERNATGRILYVSITLDDKYVIAGSQDGYLYYFNLAGELISRKRYTFSAAPYPLSFSQDGTYAAFGTAEYDIAFYKVGQGQLWGLNPTGVGGWPPSWYPSISYNGKYTAWSSYQDIVFTGKNGKTLWVRNTDGYIGALLICSTGDDLIAATANKLYFFDKDGNILWTHESPNGISAISISTNGSYVAVGSQQVVLLNRLGKVLWEYDLNGTVQAFSPFSSDGNFIAFVSWENSLNSTAYLFTRDGKSVWSHGYGLYAGAVSLSADGNYIAAGSNDGLYFYGQSGKLLWNREIGLVDSVFTTVNASYVAAVAWNSSYRGAMILYYYDRSGRLLWSKPDVNPPFSFSADKGYVMALSPMGGGPYGPVNAMSVFDGAGNVVWNLTVDRAFISSDGDYAAADTSGYKLLFVQTDDESISTLLIGVVGFAGNAVIGLALMTCAPKLIGRY
jgi:hypothetical protein